MERRRPWDCVHSRRTLPLIPRKPGDRPPSAAGAAAPRPGAAPASPAPGAERELDQLAAGIERFKLEAEKFFNGASQVPPEDLRARLARELRELQQRNLKTAVEQFRLASLEARYNSLAELYGRRLREREEGRGGRARPPAGAPAAPVYDAERGIRLDRHLEPAAVEALRAGLARGGGAVPEPAAFRAYLARQLDAIQEKTGATAAQFRLALDEGKLKLKAKPLGGGQ